MSQRNPSLSSENFSLLPDSGGTLEAESLPEGLAFHSFLVRFLALPGLLQEVHTHGFHGAPVNVQLKMLLERPLEELSLTFLDASVPFVELWQFGENQGPQKTWKRIDPHLYQKLHTFSGVFELKRDFPPELSSLLLHVLGSHVRSFVWVPVWLDGQVIATFHLCSSSTSVYGEVDYLFARLTANALSGILLKAYEAWQRIDKNRGDKKNAAKAKEKEQTNPSLALSDTKRKLDILEKEKEQWLQTRAIQKQQFVEWEEEKLQLKAKIQQERQIRLELQELLKTTRNVATNVISYSEQFRQLCSKQFPPEFLKKGHSSEFFEQLKMPLPSLFSIPSFKHIPFLKSKSSMDGAQVFSAQSSAAITHSKTPVEQPSFDSLLSTSEEKTIRSYSATDSHSFGLPEHHEPTEPNTFSKRSESSYSASDLLSVSSQDNMKTEVRKKVDFHPSHSSQKIEFSETEPIPFVADEQSALEYELDTDTGTHEPDNLFSKREPTLETPTLSSADALPSHGLLEPSDIWEHMESLSVESPPEAYGAKSSVSSASLSRSQTTTTDELDIQRDTYMELQGFERTSASTNTDFSGDSHHIAPTSSGSWSGEELTQRSSQAELMGAGHPLIFLSKEGLQVPSSVLSFFRDLQFDDPAHFFLGQYTVQELFRMKPLALSVISEPLPKGALSFGGSLARWPADETFPIMEFVYRKGLELQMFLHWSGFQSDLMPLSFWRSWLLQNRNYALGTDSSVFVLGKLDSSLDSLLRFCCGNLFHLEWTEDPVAGIQLLYQSPPHLFVLSLGEGSLQAWRSLFGELARSSRVRHVPFLLLSEISLPPDLLSTLQTLNYLLLSRY